MEEEQDKSNAELSKEVKEIAASVETTKQLLGELERGIREARAELDSLRPRTAAAIETVNQALDSARRDSGAMTALLTRATEALNATEEANRKANSEAGFAYNAKGVAEDHAKAIAQIQGTVQATFSGLTATKAKTDDLVSAMSAAAAAAAADAKAIAESKAVASRDAAQVTAAKERIEAVMPAIDQGTKDANAITAAKSGAEASAAEIRAIQTQVGELSAKAASDGASVAKADEEAKALVVLMAEARKTATEATARVTGYQNEILGLKKDFTDMKAKLESLLPHATSAGLASAFHNQKARFSKPQPYWLGLFVVAIGALLLAAGLGLPAVADTWDAILRHFVNRLPIVAPLVWLAIYAGHHYSMALRMEEDYAFKEAVSTAFEGYKREMQSIPAGPGSDVSPLVTLCENVLHALAERPGRIYDGRTDVVTPLTPAIAGIRETLAELLKGKNEKP